MTTKKCANPECAREFQPSEKRIAFCSRQCYRDSAPDFPGASTQDTRPKGAQRRWQKFRHYRAGGRTGEEACRCPSCTTANPDPASRAALIARVAAEKGVPVATTPPPPKLNPVQWARHCEKVRRGMRDQSVARWR